MAFFCLPCSFRMNGANARKAKTAEICSAGVNHIQVWIAFEENRLKYPVITPKPNTKVAIKSHVSEMFLTTCHAGMCNLELQGNII